MIRFICDMKKGMLEGSAKGFKKWDAKRIKTINNTRVLFVRN